MNLRNNKELEQKLKSRGMNRNRTLTEYEEQLGIDIRLLSQESIKKFGSFTWYDMCCGNFIAGQQLEKEDNIYVFGVDIDRRRNYIIQANVVDFVIPLKVNLVTCVQGLDYIQTYLRRGANTVINWYNQMSEGSILAFDVAKDHIKVKGEDILHYLQKEIEEDVEVFPTPTREKNHQTAKIYCRNQTIDIPKYRGLI